jgi:hypothetical protein
MVFLDHQQGECQLHTAGRAQNLAAAIKCRRVYRSSQQVQAEQCQHHAAITATLVGEAVTAQLELILYRGKK